MDRAKFLRELVKFDIKTRPVPGRHDKAIIDFALMYYSLESLGVDDDGIAPVAQLLTPTRHGETGTVLIPQIYDLSPWGLSEAREKAVGIAKYLYDLPADMRVVESDGVPVPCANRNYNVIYRVDGAWTLREKLKEAIRNRK